MAVGYDFIIKKISWHMSAFPELLNVCSLHIADIDDS